MSQNEQPLTGKPIVTITWDDLGTRKVEQRLKEQQAMSRTRAYATLDSNLIATDAPSRASLLQNTMFCMIMLGVLGGVLAWACGLITKLQSSEQLALDTIHGIHRIEFQRDEQHFTADEAAKSIAILSNQAQLNPYYVAITDPFLTPGERASRLTALERRAKVKQLSLNVVSFGLSGMLLALCLGIAEPLTERNLPAAAKNGALSAVLGLVGGITVSIFIDQLYRSVAGDSSRSTKGFTLQDMFAHAAAWGVLGLFLTAGPGLLLRNPRKLAIGIAGGLIGGVVGGALFDPIQSLAGVDTSRLIALIAIGGIAGFSTAMIENVAKTGWLRVTHGLIAGKQFILYRNPTYIGSAPDTQIYLFRDPQVGRRHAALHLMPGGIDIEDLPLGSQTLVNGRPVSRLRLHHGDEIAVGGTRFQFQERAAPRTRQTTPLKMPTLLVEIFGRRKIADLAGRVIIGRSPVSEVRVDDRSVSRIHAWIASDGKIYYFNDAGSRFGSRINGQLVHGRVKLTDGDQIRVGPAKLRFREKTSIPPGFELIDLDDARRQRGENFVDCQCGAPLLTPWDYGGQYGRCRHCGNNVHAAPSEGKQPAVAAGTCGACHSDINPGEDLTACPDCGVAFHATCWTENLGCSSYGCKQVGILDPAYQAPAEALEFAPVDDSDFADLVPDRSIDWSYPLLAAALVSGVVGLLAFGIPPAFCLIGTVAYRRKAGPKLQRGLFFATTAITLLATGLGAAVSWYWWIAGRTGMRTALL